MAFQQPTFVPPSRPTTAHEPQHQSIAPLPSPLRDLQESQEWVLFPRARSSTQIESASTEQASRTAGLSDFGSLTARSRLDEDIACEATDGSIEEDEELDSLDDGLHAFRGPGLRSDYFDQSGSILPRHDGLGTFPASTLPVQEQLWHFERYNPRKRSLNGHQRRRSSVQRRLDAVEHNDNVILESERTQRIEKWRLDQSRLLLAEIEKETRRQRVSVHSQRAERAPSTTALEQIIKETADARTADRATGRLIAPEKDAPEESESFWERITRRVIRDFIGIDDATLSVILGESLDAEEVSAIRNPASSLDSSKAIRLDSSILSQPNLSWEKRLLDRIARELGILLNQLSDHPGAFNPPPRLSTIPYAGIPVTVPTSSKTQSKLSPSKLTTSFEFNPTLPDTPPLPPNFNESSHAALWGIEEEPITTAAPQDERHYWEQPPDLKTVFRFLHNRFTAQRRPAPTAKAPLNIATSSTPDSIRRAAIIRQYHPLASRAAAAAAASSWDTRRGHGRRHSLLRGRNGSSCASSVVGSARRMGVRGASMGSSSRNYWDIGDSISGVAGIGGLGAWGEV